MYLTNCFRHLLVSSLFLSGQLRTLSTLVFSVFHSLAYCTGISDGLLFVYCVYLGTLDGVSTIEYGVSLRRRSDEKGLNNSEFLVGL
jgi:hypothetical protein